MALKEDLEILRGEPISVFEGDPMDIPCVETSDVEKLCKNPVVSVHMITYNHEPYIRQAIEGVMMQKTDFEFELVIGEDASTDRTREICFEYQKKHPDKIRVLWWHENVSKLGGGNGRRVTAHCRGEFIAFCEGDDYWTDSLKLQKQVSVMRDNPHVSLCFGRAKVLDQERGVTFDEPITSLSGRIISGQEFSKRRLFDFFCDSEIVPIPNSSTRTLTALVRRSVMSSVLDCFQELFAFSLKVGDTAVWFGCSYFGNVYFMADDVAVYRMHAGGVTQRDSGGVLCDGTLIRIYYAMKMWGMSYQLCLYIYKDMLFNGRIMNAEKLGADDQRDMASRMQKFVEYAGAKSLRYKSYLFFLRHGCLTKMARKMCDFVFWHFRKQHYLLRSIYTNSHGAFTWKGMSTSQYG